MIRILVNRWKYIRANETEDNESDTGLCTCNWWVNLKRITFTSVFNTIFCVIFELNFSFGQLPKLNRGGKK